MQVSTLTRNYMYKLQNQILNTSSKLTDGFIMFGERKIVLSLQRHMWDFLNWAFLISRTWIFWVKTQTQRRNFTKHCLHNLNQAVQVTLRMSPLVQVRHQDLSVAVDVSAGHDHHLRRGLHKADGRSAWITFLQPQSHWSIVAFPFIKHFNSSSQTDQGPRFTIIKDVSVQHWLQVLMLRQNRRDLRQDLSPVIIRLR